MQGPRIDYQINPRFVPDDIPVWLGNNKDAALIFDNANDEWTVQTRNAAGTLTDRLRIKANTDTPSADLVDIALKWTAGRAVTAADYSIGRDLDATNQLHLNVPAGATFELSVNDAPEFVVSATQIDLKSNDLVNVNSATITGATGNTLIVDTNTLVVDATNNRVGVLTATPANALSVGVGSLFNVLSTGEVRSIDGLVTAPTYSFTSDPNTGMYAIPLDQIGFATNGVVRLQVSDAAITLGSGAGNGDGVRLFSIQDAVTPPPANPAGGGLLYSQAGSLRWKSPSGAIFNATQGAAVADASGGATVDAEARTAINALLARVRVHGLIA
jgi:hypothetical protein